MLKNLWNIMVTLNRFYKSWRRVWQNSLLVPPREQLPWHLHVQHYHKACLPSTKKPSPNPTGIQTLWIYCSVQVDFSHLPTLLQMPLKDHSHCANYWQQEVMNITSVWFIWNFLIHWKVTYSWVEPFHSTFSTHLSIQRYSSPFFNLVLLMFGLTFWCLLSFCLCFVFQSPL